MKQLACLVTCLVLGLNRTDGEAVELGRPIEIIRAVGANGQGSGQAAQAWRQLARAEVRQLPDLLEGMDAASPLARNWLRSAIDEVLQRAQKDSTALPRDALESFLLDTRHDPQARRLAYELVLDKDQTAAERFLPAMLDDPSPDLRRDAVARLLDQAEKTFASPKKGESLPLFEKCLASARDKGQIDKTVRRLRELGHPVDLPAHFGFIMDWKLLGPFSNVKEKGFDSAFPPEDRFDPAAEYDGKAGKIHWHDYVTKNDNGLVDLHAGVGKFVEAAAYALAEFTSAADKNAEIRIGCFTAFKLWVNGELVLVRGDAYTGMSFDHYLARVHLRQGKNTILLKSCLDDPPPQVPKMWQFQLRVCDASGAAILSTTRPAPSSTEKKS